MSQERDAPQGPSAPGDAAAQDRGGAWALPLLLLVAAGAALPDLFDVDVFKTGAVALLAALVILPWIAARGRDGLRAWLRSPAAWLFLGTLVLALPGAHGPWPRAAFSDRLLTWMLATIAAVLGLCAARAARGAPGLRALGALATALQFATLLTAIVVLLQAVGIEERFTPPASDFLRRELVGLMGNSTRAGALLALGVTAAFCAVTTRGVAVRDAGLRLALATLLLGTAALVLTRARGGWLGAAAGMAGAALCDPAGVRASARLWLTRLVLGVGLAVVLAGGPQVLTHGKLEESPGPLSGGDVTVSVRFAVWRGTLEMIGVRPVSGWGLGAYHAEFPPFRDPAEAALPGLGGARTEVDHPHDEFLLAAVEGGLPAALCLLAFVVLTGARAWRGARAGEARDLSRLGFGVVLASTVTACVQNAWSTPGTALPFFAAAGCVWAVGRDAEGTDETRGARLLTLAGVLAAMALLVVLALPRLQAHLRLRAFYERANREGIDPRNFAILASAAEADPGDVDVQRLLLAYGTDLLQAMPSAGPDITGPVARARERLALLAPHAAPPR